MFGQASGYRLIRAAPRVVFAGAARIGLATGFVREVETPPGSGPRRQPPRAPGERAVLRRGQHDRPRLCAGQAGRAGNNQRSGLSARRERGHHHERGGAGAADWRARRRGVSGRRQRLRKRLRHRLRRDSRERRIRAEIPVAYRTDPGGPRLQAVAPRDPVRASRGSDGVSPSIGQAF